MADNENKHHHTDDMEGNIHNVYGSLRTCGNGRLAHNRHGGRDSVRSVPLLHRNGNAVAFRCCVNRVIHLVTHSLIYTVMTTKRRRNKTAAQQSRHYEVENIFEYMVETYLNGNFSTFKELYHELNREARKDFVEFLFSEVNPQYHIEIIKETI